MDQQYIDRVERTLRTLYGRGSVSCAGLALPILFFAHTGDGPQCGLIETSVDDADPTLSATEGLATAMVKTGLNGIVVAGASQEVVISDRYAVMFCALDQDGERFTRVWEIRNGGGRSRRLVLLDELSSPEAHSDNYIFRALEVGYELADQARTVLTM